MGINKESADKAEKIAKDLSQKYYGTTAMWEICLSEAYAQLFKLDKESKDE